MNIKKLNQNHYDILACTQKIKYSRIDILEDSFWTKIPNSDHCEGIKKINEWKSRMDKKFKGWILWVK